MDVIETDLLGLGLPVVTRIWYQEDSERSLGLLAMDLGCARNCLWCHSCSLLSGFGGEAAEASQGVTDGLEHLTTGPDF